MALNHRPLLWTCALALTLSCGSESAETADPQDISSAEETAQPDAPSPVSDAAPEDTAPPTADAAPDAEAPIVDAAPDITPPIDDATSDAPAPAPDAALDTAVPTEDAAAQAPDLQAPTDDVPTAPVDLLAQLPTCTTGVVEAAIAPPLPKTAGADAFTPWDGAEWDAVMGLVLGLYGDDAQGVLAGVASIDYTVCRGAGDEANLVLFQPAQPDTGHARAVWRMGPARALVLEAPHPIYDMQTPDEAAYLFEATQARGLITSGTHRCVSDVPSGCDGKTKTCSSTSKPYTLTDMAHVVVSVFQALHGAFELGLKHVAETAETAGPEDYLMVSVHGMAGDGISLSNGTKADTHAGMLPAQLTLALMAALPDAYVTSCNDFAGAVVDDRLCGTTNTQGRWTNGSEEPCTEAAAAASGHFAHMEQALEIRQNPEPVAEALMSVLTLWD